MWVCVRHVRHECRAKLRLPPQPDANGKPKSPLTENVMAPRVISLNPDFLDTITNIVLFPDLSIDLSMPVDCVVET